MRTMTISVCDVCDNLVIDPGEGFIIQGNIYAGDLDLGGLIGNNFPDQAEVDHFVKDGVTTPDRFMEAVQKTCYCKSCFLKALNITTLD